MIEVKSLSKNYGSKLVLHNIDLRFEDGKVYGIAGENGAGKTTLFRCIAGLENHVGEVFSDRKPLKNHLGLMMTEQFFFNKMTGREYIRLLCNARGVDITDINSKNLFQLPLDEYATVYSTGMKKKLALIAILLQSNQYFILDEPYNGVDFQSNLIITEVIHKLKSLGKTVIISSHIFSTLSDTCDQIHWLSQGTIKKSAEKEGFSAIESEMKKAGIGSALDHFDFK